MIMHDLIGSSFWGNYIYALRRLLDSIKVDMGISSSSAFFGNGWMHVVGYVGHFPVWWVFGLGCIGAARHRILYSINANLLLHHQSG